jgi:hypothetical protein
MLLGLGAAAIPLILHLIARRQPPTVVFPALRYLVDTAREHQRRLRLHHLLLLLVRTALIVALVLAASAPSVPISGVPGHAPSALVVIVDNSVSSGAVAGGTAVVEPLRQAAADVLSRATPEDALWLLTADGLARGGSRETLTATVDSVAATAMRLDLGEAIMQADAILAGEERAGEILLITDLQRSAVSPAVIEAPLVVVRPEGDVVANVGVGSAETGTQPWQRHGGRLLVTVEGDVDRPVPLSVSAGGRPERQALAPPGVPVAVTISGLTPGWWPVVVSVDPDELRADDRRTTAVRVAPVAGVTWNPADLHVATAAEVLEADGRLRRGNEVTVGGLGRGLSVVFPPADPAELGALNRALGRRGVAWRFGDLVQVAELSDSSALVGEVDVARRYRLERSTAGGTGVLTTVGGDPWIVRDAGVVLVGSRFDPEWTMLPLSAEFVPFVDALVNRVARGEMALRQGTPGGTVLLPDRTTEVHRGQRSWTVEGGAPFIPHSTGLYYLVEGLDTMGVLAVNIDGRESHLERATDRAIRQLWHPTRIIAPERAGDAVFAAGARGDLRGPLLWLVLVLALVEVGLASLRKRES